jgi:transcriptional regulator with XRE-family HTH domain
MGNSLAEKIARNLRKIRLRKGYSQIQAADLANMHFTYYSQIERALRKDVSVRILKNITDAFGVTVNDVIY